MNRRSHLRSALGLLLGLALPPCAMAQEVAPAAELPSAESILDRYIEITGGAAAYESRMSEVSTGTFQIVSAGLTGQLQVFAEPGLMRTTIELPGVGLIEAGVKDGVAWRVDPIAGPSILQGFEAEFTIMSSELGAAARWREQYKAVETAGIEDVNGEPAYRVVLTLPGGSVTNFYSVDSGLLSKTTLGPVELSYHDYMDFAGILTPSRIVQMAAGQRVVIGVTSVEANGEILDAVFDPPESVQALLK